MSAKARGYDETLLDGYKARVAMPDKLVEGKLNRMASFVIEIINQSLIHHL